MLLGIRLNELGMVILFNFLAKWNFKPLIINSLVVMNQKDGFYIVFGVKPIFFFREISLHA